MLKSLIRIPLIVLCFMPIIANADGTPDQIKLQIDPMAVVGTISPDFIGLGFETSSVAQPHFFSGTNKKMVRLYRNLTRHGLMRIGGNISDHTLYVPDGESRVNPETDVTVINRTNLENLGNFAKATGWKVMWGLNAATDTVDDGILEAKAVKSALDKQLQSFEVGNEVDFHSEWHEKFDEYYPFYQNYKAKLRSAIPNVPLSGPDSAASTDWVSSFASRETNDPKLYTCHYYRGGAPTPDANLDTLLGPDARLDNMTPTLNSVSKTYGVPYRMNEMNSFWGGGKDGVSDTFGSALWVLDIMYKLASNGCSGVNIETDINQHGWISHYSPIVHDSSGGCDVRPEYYGMLSFALAGQGDLIGCNLDKDSINIDAFATKTVAGPLWVTIINKDMLRDSQVEIPMPKGYSKVFAYRLSAPDVASGESVSLAGSTVDSDGNWKPHTLESIEVVNGSINPAVPHASALILKMTR